MSRTYHHNAPARDTLLRRPDRYTGWTGEGSPRAWVRRLGRRIARHYARLQLRKEIEA